MTDESTVHVMMGLPGSGKSSLAATLDAVRFSLDDYRAMMGSSDWDGDMEKVAQKSMMDGVLRAVDDGWDVVIDNTHLGRGLPERYRRSLSSRPVTFRVHDLTSVAIEECIRRDASRSKPVGERVISQMWERHRTARRGGWRMNDAWMNEYRDFLRPIAPYAHTPGLPDAVVFDIDGTLALHHGRGPYQFDRCRSDLLNEPVAAALRAYIAAGVQPVLLSSRQSEYRDATCDWLENVMGEEMFAVDPPLFMRPVDNREADFIVKAKLFEENIRGVYNVISMYDDRNQVVEMWRRIYRLPVMHVADGDF